MHMQSAHPPTSGEDAGVHERGHAEVGQNEQEDDAIVDGHGHRETLWKPRTPETHTERTAADSQKENQSRNLTLHSTTLILYGSVVHNYYHCKYSNTLTH